MPKVKTVEKQIWDCEGFDVNLKFNGKDLRGDKQGLLSYPYVKAMKNNSTI